MKRLAIPALILSCLAPPPRLAAQAPPPDRAARVVSRYLIGFPNGKQAVGTSRIVVDANADLINLRRDKDLIWFVQVSKDRKVVWKHDYAGQPLRLTAGTRLTPTFHETLQMPPGEYRVAVGLKQLRVVGVAADGSPVMGYESLVSDTLRATVN